VQRKAYFEFMVVDVAVFVCVKELECLFDFMALFVCYFLSDVGMVAGGGVELGP
jgi:hypothetical protein